MTTYTVAAAAAGAGAGAGAAVAVVVPPVLVTPPVSAELLPPPVGAQEESNRAKGQHLLLRLEIPIARLP
ncbi:MAG: hypothetical protein NTZ90_11985 [Proteobacteria bacterium]|nr:hypothetical protein [Pseudomonadota bacterium]